ncbi:MAG: polysaccharide biosynthesis protein, partial [bacterium]
MLNQLKKRNFYLLLSADIAVFAVSLVLSYFVRYTFDIPLAEFHRILEILPWVIAVKCLTFIALSVYRGMWRYTSLPDAINLAKACILASLIIITGITVFNRFDGYPRSVFLADSIFTLFFCGGIRLGIRFYYSGKRARSGKPDEMPQHRIRVILIGAG